MTREQEEQLDEIAEHLASARQILSDMTEGFNTGADDNPDDEPEDTGEAVEAMEAMVSGLEEMENALDDLREILQG